MLFRMSSLLCWKEMVMALGSSGRNLSFARGSIVTRQQPAPHPQRLQPTPTRRADYSRSLLRRKPILPGDGPRRLLLCHFEFLVPLGMIVYATADSVHYYDPMGVQYRHLKALTHRAFSPSLRNRTQVHLSNNQSTTKNLGAK